MDARMDYDCGGGADSPLRNAMRGGGGGDDGGGDVTSTDGFEESFKAFCAQPENAKIMAEHQFRELRKTDRVGHRVESMQFREAVLGADEEAQRNIAPFLRTRVLKNIISSFKNDAHGDFGKWARNPLVLEMLRDTQRAIDEGRANEEEIERTMVNYLRDPNNLGHAEFTKATTREARLESKDLVGALNEQCQLRYKGNDFYNAKEFDKARECYVRALSIMKLVKGTNPMDHAEVVKNKLACLMNLGSACMGLKLYGEAITYLNEAEEENPDDLRLLLRRGRAYAQRGDFDDAKRDFTRVLQLDPFDDQAQYELYNLKSLRAKDHARRVQLSKNIFAAKQQR
jgi:tetratricopeptide (TPR) repeat protein